MLRRGKVITQQASPREKQRDFSSPVFKVPAGECSKILAVSPFKKAKPSEILRFVEALPQGLIVLPGHFVNTPSARQLQRAIRRGTVVFAEGPKRTDGRPAFLITRQKIITMPPQIFARAPSAAQMDHLASILPQRTIAVGKRRITFFICGELIAFNPDGTTKHKRRLEFDILVNPAHTIMGHWNHLGKKLKRLALRSMAVYVTNNNRNHHLSSDVRIYKGGVLMERHSDVNIGWSECEI